jgi:hypothetical protein
LGSWIRIRIKVKSRICNLYFVKVNSRIQIRIKVKGGSFGGSHRAIRPNPGVMKAKNGAEETYNEHWRIFKPVVADSHPFNEKPEPDPHQSNRPNPDLIPYKKVKSHSQTQNSMSVMWSATLFIGEAPDRYQNKVGSGSASKVVDPQQWVKSVFRICICRLSMFFRLLDPQIIGTDPDP